MADEVESTPVKRGPGRPRKIKVEAEVEVKPEVAPEPEKPEVKSDPADPRIGQFVSEGAHWISYPDGAEYRIVDGHVSERVH